MPAVMTAPAETFGTRLEAARAASGLSQRQLAIRIGVRPSTVNAWFTGRNVPQLDLACKVAQVLSVPLESLCDPSWHVEPREDGAEEES